MLNRNLALVADTKKITPSQLTKVAAALQKQATRDFGPLWDIQANVSGFAKLEDPQNMKAQPHLYAGAQPSWLRTRNSDKQRGGYSSFG